MERPSSLTTKENILNLETENGLLVHIRSIEQLYLLLRSAGVSERVAFQLALHVFLGSYAGSSTWRKLEELKKNWYERGHHEPF